MRSEVIFFENGRTILGKFFFERAVLGVARVGKNFFDFRPYDPPNRRTGRMARLVKRPQAGISARRWAGNWYSPSGATIDAPSSRFWYNRQ